MDSGDPDPDIVTPGQNLNIQNELQESNQVDFDAGKECQSLEASSMEKSQDAAKSESDSQSSNTSSVNKSEAEINGEECQTPLVPLVNKSEMDVDGEQGSKRADALSVDALGAGVSVKAEEDKFMVPAVGMEFESEEHAYKCYSRYAVLEGFSIRKDFVNKSRVNGAVVSRRYTCYRQGYRPSKHNANVRKPRQETRTGCLAHMTIARQSNGKFRVTHFETKHNHEFANPSTTRILPSQKRLTFAQAVEADLASSSGMDGVPMLGMGFESEDHAYEFYNTYAGRVGFSVRKDYVNRSKVDGAVVSRRFTCFREGFRQKDKRDPNVKRPRKETRIGCLAQLVISRQSDGKYRVTHFEEKHNHELVAACRVRMLRSQKRLAVHQTVEGDALEGHSNQAKSAYEVSCNSIGHCVDHGYDPIDHRRVNHHKQMVIFGAALLYDETVDSFKWLFQKFLEAMSGKKPKTILSEQDAVVSEAINSVFPETEQRMCAWHVYQSALKQLSHTFVGSPSFVDDLSSCIFDHEEEEDFIAAWNLMLDIHSLWENECLNKMFETREQWAIAYRRHIFGADIKSVQLHESIIVNLKKYLKPEYDVLSFFKHLSKVVNDWHYKEIEANYNMSQNMPKLMGDVILLKHVRDAYTPRIFELFQQQYETCLNIVVNQCIESETRFEYKVTIYGQPREYALTSHVNHGRHLEALSLFHHMQTSPSLTLDAYAYPLVLKSCSAIHRPQLGSSIHAHATKSSLLSNPFVACALVDMYGKCFSITFARKLFDEIPQRNVVVWNSMISIYTRLGLMDEALHLFHSMDVRPDESTFNSIISSLSELEDGRFKAIEFYRRMQEAGLRPNLITLLALLPACVGVAALASIKEIHGYAVRSNIEPHPQLRSGLVEAYGRCGCLVNAQNVFQCMKERDVVAWSSLISAYALQGEARAALEVFRQMELAKVWPDDITFLGVLKACSHAGLADEALDYFERMQKEYRIELFINGVCSAKLVAEVDKGKVAGAATDLLDAASHSTTTSHSGGGGGHATKPEKQSEPGTCQQRGVMAMILEVVVAMGITWLKIS
ncbi:hypothetical protein COLO4_29258 [Corchorus olitorius]|uniref:Protein FAR1-RELATED SEQUENCE n=1 Tax=Corchorus olitorius TaxID=93759 RepID=A0A1R3HFN6_9ROSI|nr:hypothetical protein COLO4_29258 [Corchorus olitorius]